MQGRNHVALALTVPLAWAMFNDPILPTSAIGWGSLIIGSLSPDLDGEGSICYLGNFLPRHITPKPVVRVLNWVGRTISSGIRAILGHRAALHAPIWGVLMIVAGMNILAPARWPSLLSMPNIGFGSGWLFWFGIGYLLHIFGDSLTKSGVPLFWPIVSKDISFAPMVTGKFIERAFGVLLWLFVGWRIVMILPYSDWLWQLYYRFYPEMLPR